MKIDIGRHIGAVTRRLENREHEGKIARVALASRTYDTTIDDLWDAITSAERIPRWFLPISGDLRLGGRYQLGAMPAARSRAASRRAFLA